MARALSWQFLILAILMNAGASLLLKLSTAFDGVAKVVGMGASVACYGLAFLSYFICLQSIPVSIAYPVITAGGILVIVLSAAAFLGEPLTGSKVLGAGLVILGGILLLRRS